MAAATVSAQRPSSTRQRTTPRASSSVRSAPTSSQRSSVSSVDLVSRRIAIGQSYFDEAKKYISDALSEDEGGRRMEALELYNESLTLLRSGLASLRTSMEGGVVTGQLSELISKMERMKDQIKSRMEVLLQLEIEERTRAKNKSNQTSQTSSQTSQTGQATSAASEDKEETKADVLFNTDRGIALFEVDTQEHVRRYEDADALSVFKYREKIEGQPPAFLQCGGFVYPLVKGKSPILKSGERMYMFPELRGEDGTVLGVILDGASEDELSQFDSLLTDLATLKAKDDVTVTKETGEQKMGVAEGEESQWGSTMAEKIDKGVTWVSIKIAQGTEAAGNLISKGANKLREKIDPNEKPTEIPESVQKGLHYTRKATGYVVGVSDYLMLSLAKLTVRVGRETSKAVANTEMVKNADIHPQAKEAWKVTKSGLKGAAAMFVDLEKGAVAIVKSVGKETSKTVSHKYGEDAGQVTDDSLAAASNTAVVAHTYWSWKTWGIHFVGKVGEVIAKESREKKEKLQTSKTDK